MVARQTQIRCRILSIRVCRDHRRQSAGSFVITQHDARRRGRRRERWRRIESGRRQQQQQQQDSAPAESVRMQWRRRQWRAFAQHQTAAICASTASSSPFSGRQQQPDVFCLRNVTSISTRSFTKRSFYYTRKRRR